MTGHGIWGHIPTITEYMTSYDGICQVVRIPDDVSFFESTIYIYRRTFDRLLIKRQFRPVRGQPGPAPRVVTVGRHAGDVTVT